jgi:hypothetical protein
VGQGYECNQLHCLFTGHGLQLKSPTPPPPPPPPSRQWYRNGNSPSLHQKAKHTREITWRHFPQSQIHLRAVKIGLPGRRRRDPHTPPALQPSQCPVPPSFMSRPPHNTPGQTASPLLRCIYEPRPAPPPGPRPGPPVTGPVAPAVKPALQTI